MTDGVDGFDELEGARSITTTVISDDQGVDRTYALIASWFDHGVQIIDITDPSSPSAVSSVTDGVDGFDELEGARSVTTTVIGGKTYALVASYSDDGVQIIDITTPASPTAVASVTDGSTFDKLDGASSITTVVIGGTTYALVASYEDHGVQIMELNDDTASTAALSKQGVLVYPNPVQNKLQLVYPTVTQATYSVYDLTGKIRSTHHASGQTHQLNVSSLAKGVYLLEAKHGGQTGVFRFVKE